MPKQFSILNAQAWHAVVDPDVLSLFQFVARDALNSESEIYELTSQPIGFYNNASLVRLRLEQQNVALFWVLQGKRVLRLDVNTKINTDFAALLGLTLNASIVLDYLSFYLFFVREIHNQQPNIALTVADFQYFKKSLRARLNQHKSCVLNVGPDDSYFLCNCPVYYDSGVSIKRFLIRSSGQVNELHSDYLGVAKLIYTSVGLSITDEKQIEFNDVPDENGGR